MTVLAVAGTGAATRAPRGWLAARRVLAVRLDNLGDVLMTTPALAAIRRTLPAAQLTLLASPGGAAAAAHVPELDDVIPFEAPWVSPPARPGGVDGALGQAEARLVDRLSERGFDAAVIFTVCTQSALPAALLCRMAGIPLRAAHARENPYGLLSDWLPERDQVVQAGMRHEVQRQLDLVAALGFEPADARLRFQVGAADTQRAQRRLLDAGLDPQRPYFVVHCGASAPSRRYPAPAFGAAAELIARHSGCTAVFTGSAGEHALIEEARRCMSEPSVSLAGRLELGDLGAVIARARVLVANNTGPVHMAAALDTPVVDLYALTNPQHTPWQVRARVLNHDVPCRNCLKSRCPQGHHDCLRRVEPQQVADAALQLMHDDDRVPRLLPSEPGGARTTPSHARAALTEGCAA